ETSAGPVLVPGRAPASSVAAASLAQFATPTVGAMYTNGDDGYQYWCSASTVPSGNRNLILTAAHCVYDRDRGTWRTKGIYMPFYRYGPDPAYGSWVLDQAFVSQDWLSGGGRTNDVAFVTVRPRSDGVRIEDVTGSNGMGFFPPPWYQGTVFGYPGEPPYDGNLQMNCTVYISLSIAKCPFTGGSSGGPWVRDYQNERRWGYVTGLTSTGVAGTDVRSPDFGFSAYSLWQGAQAG
ncbi:hypothetical protein, partial [Microbispora sp. NPDC049633]|uniref:trypsin-like serine peptidase n=1 Tax=Microbispora sp. NPDC049633 TaxID=3154355 RepID=UPI00344AC957